MPGTGSVGLFHPAIPNRVTVSMAATGAFCGGLPDGSPHVQQALAESTTSLFDFRELELGVRRPGCSVR